MNRQRHSAGQLLRHLTRQRLLAFILLLIASQQILLVHAAEHSHTGANVSLCMICAAADFSTPLISGPVLPTQQSLPLPVEIPARLTLAITTPTTTGLPRAPPALS